MLLLGHAGITLGAAVLLNGALSKDNPARRKKSDLDSSGHITALFTALSHRIDIRLLLIGSLLPDIIDKPIGQLLFRESFSNGRIFSHTLLFLGFISLIGVYLYRSHRQTWLLVLASGTFTHLIFDQMWLSPETLLWPAYGLAFERIDLTDWTGNILHALLTKPAVYIPEMVGGLILFYFAGVLLKHRLVLAFLHNRKLKEV